MLTKMMTRWAWGFDQSPRLGFSPLHQAAKFQRHCTCHPKKILGGHGQNPPRRTKHSGVNFHSTSRSDATNVWMPSLPTKATPFQCATAQFSVQTCVSCKEARFVSAKCGLNTKGALQALRTRAVTGFAGPCRPLPTGPTGLTDLMGLSPAGALPYGSYGWPRASGKKRTWEVNKDGKVQTYPRLSKQKRDSPTTGQMKGWQLHLALDAWGPTSKHLCASPAVFTRPFPTCCGRLTWPCPTPPATAMKEIWDLCVGITSQQCLNHTWYKR